MWTYQEKEIETLPEDAFGFIYQITNMLDGRDYVGQKRGWIEYSKPPLKGMKRKRKFKKESDWRTYWSSCDELKADVERLGEENFQRRIIRYCTSKSTLNYYETKALFESDALLREDSYNRYVGCRINSNQLRAKVR